MKISQLKAFSLVAVMFFSAIICHADKITIRPEFNVGDTIKYKVDITQSILFDDDYGEIKITMLPQIIVKGKNEAGYILRTINELDKYEIKSSDPEAEASVAAEAEWIKDEITSLQLSLQLDTQCRFDSILNINDIRKHFRNMFSKEEGYTVNDSNVNSLVKMRTIPRFLVEQQFGGIPYFQLIGKELESGKISADEVLSYEYKEYFPSITDLNINVLQEMADNAESDAHVVNNVRINGNGATSPTFSGDWTFIDGILKYAQVILRYEADEGTFNNRYEISRIN